MKKLMIRVTSITVILGFIAINTALADEVVPVSAQFQVNTYTTSWQGDATVEGVPGADSFLVVWSSTENRLITGRFMNADGSALGGEFQVNTDTTSFNQFEADIGFGSDGRFVVAWESDSDGSASGLVGRRFDSAGVGIGDQFFLTSVTTGYQQGASLIMKDDDGFFVMFTNGDTVSGDGSEFTVNGQEFDSNGSMVGSLFQVNTNTTGRQWEPEAARDASGAFVVVWRAYEDGDSNSVQGRRFDSDGSALGDEFQVNSFSTGRQVNGVVAKQPDGDFMVVWQSGNFSTAGPDGDRAGIAGQSFTSAGTPIGGEFVVNTWTTSQQVFPTIATHGAERFMVTWTSYYQDGDNEGIFGQLLEVDGSPIGDEFQINTYTTEDQFSSAVAVKDRSDFLVVWQSGLSAGTDNLNDSIQSQALKAYIFRDGFESGDTSAWSSTLP